MDRKKHPGSRDVKIVLPAALAALLALLVAGGCSAPADRIDPDVGQPLWKNLELDRIFAEGRNLTDEDLPYPWEKELEFFQDLTNRRTASVNDGIKAVTLFLGGSPWGKDADELARRLADKGMFDTDWEFGDDVPLTKGVVSYMICEACDIRGGVWLTLFGPSQRYCAREAVYLEIVNAGSLHQYVSGSELLNIISEADLYRKERNPSSRRG